MKKHMIRLKEKIKEMYDKIKRKIKGIFIFSERYKIYKNKINKNTNIEDLQFKRIKMERKIEIVNSPVLYMTIAISISSLMMSLISYDKKNIKLTAAAVILGIILLVITIILSNLNIAQFFINRSSRWKSEVIKLRIEELKQKNPNKNRRINVKKIKTKNQVKRENEFNNILKQEKNDIKEIKNFLKIK